MGSLENALQLAHTVGETVAKVQGPLDVHLMMEHIHKKFEELHKQGPQDLWWQSVHNLYDDCVKNAPKDCRTLGQYAEWATHMIRFWLTLLSAREMLVTWAGRDPTSLETTISPNHSLIQTRDLDPAIDFPKGQQSPIETIGNETMEALKKRGIDCFDPWTTANYRTRLSIASVRKQAKVLFNEKDRSLLCGFYSWTQHPPLSPPSAVPKERIIGKESLRTRTLWPAEITPGRMGFRHVPGGAGITSINEHEAALRIALDLMKISIDTKLPLVLPKKKS